MNSDFFYIIIIALLALSLASFQYLYKAKRKGNDNFLFALFRFVTFFILGLLLLNPKIKQKTTVVQKTNLIVAVDNSNSILLKNKNQEVYQFLEALKNSNLTDKFNIKYYSFDESLEVLKDSLKFTSKHTNIAKAFSELKEINSSIISPTILLTDGNQTHGQDYTISSLTYKNPIYPVVLGDSIIKSDLKIQSIQHNKYAFLNNKFPVEVVVSYQGNEAVKTNFSVSKDNTIVYTIPLEFNSNKTTQVINFELPASHNGKCNYKAKVNSLIQEENTIQ